ncbi:MAG TPA: molybdopterin-dependent oxidoreductase [Bryobacteraceae bacterium]|nr:molybdopterin-dependent oxidoreductase [Bryobacteraceae bacterium]
MPAFDPSVHRLATCALDCPDTCSVLVTIDPATGRASKIQGDPNHAVTQGFLCAKVTRYLERVNHLSRLLTPLRRTGPKGSGQFEPISWDHALDAVAENLKQNAAEFGSEAILPYSYAGTMGLLQGSGMDHRFFHRLGASRLDRTICSEPGTVGLVNAIGQRLAPAPEHFVHAKLIIAWGANILSTNVHLWPFIVEARRRGAKLYVIDPIRTKIATLADHHFTPYPGSDLALALGLIYILIRDGLTDADYIDQYTTGYDSLAALAAQYPPNRAAHLTGIPAREIEQLAHDYASTKPSVIRLNYGVQRSERGGRAVQAIALSPALTGAWRDLGGGIQLSTSAAFEFNRLALERPDLQQIPLGREARLLNMSQLGRVLTETENPPIKSLVVYNSNPGAMAPNQSLVRKGLVRPDLFTTVIDHFLTDTARFADIVLPATMFLEHDDLYLAYGHYHLQLALKASEPPPGPRPNVKIFRSLAKRMGFTEPCFDDTTKEMVSALLDTPSPHLQGLTWDRLVAEHSIRLNVPEKPFAEGGFRTPTGRCNLSAEDLAYTPPVESRLGIMAGSYPLELVSSKNHDSLNSSFGHRPDVDAQTSILQIHPTDAAARCIADGQQVDIYNDRGVIRLTASVGDYTRPGVVRAPMVRWGVNVNTLISDRLTDIGGGPTFYNCLVEVRPCEGPVSFT